MKSQVCCTSIIVLYNNISVFTMFLTQGKGMVSLLKGLASLARKRKQGKNAKKQ